MQTWAKIAVVLIVLGVVAAWAKQTQQVQPTQGDTPHVKIQCTVIGDEGTCVLQNIGKSASDVEVDVIAVCRDGDHSAHLTARVEAGNHTTRIIKGFAPPIEATKCAGVDYRNFAVK